MPFFHYRAVSPAGEVVEGELEALDRRFAVRRLQDDGYTPLRAYELGTAAGAEGWSGWRPARRKLPVGDIALLSNEIGTLLRAGLPVDHALTVLASLAGKTESRAFVSRTLQKIRSGATLADALQQQADILPSYYVGLVRAGEASNTLGTVFARLAQLLNRAKAVRERVRSALIYPMIVLVVAGITLTVLLTVVIPQFRPLLENAGATLPLSTRMVMAVSDMVRDFWWALLLGPIVMIVGAGYHYRSKAGRSFWDTMLLKVPVLGKLIINLDVARFTRTLGTLLQSGVAEVNALAIASTTVTNRAVSNALTTVGARLRRGDGWSAPLRDTKVFPELAVQLIHVGEESGQLDDMLMQAGDIFDENAQQTLERLLALLVPAITMLLGLIVAVVIGSMLVAILSTYNLPV